MRAFGLFGRKRIDRKIKPTPAPKPTPVDQFTGCTFCGHDRFYEGPCGGLSVNLTCTRCGARFNIGCFPTGPVLLNTLSGPEETG
jgi:transcription elongation factor Elf1